MKNVFKFIFLMMFLFGCSSTKTSNKTLNKMTSDSVSNKADLKLPKFEKMQLENGIQLYFLSDQSLPQFTIQAVLSKGSAEDPKNKSGLASITMAMLKEGSGDYSSEEYKSMYSKYSSEFEYEVEKDSTIFRSTGLTKYDDQIMDLFLDTLFKTHLLNPLKSKKITEEFNKIKQKRISQINKSVENAPYFANNVFQSLLFKNQNYAFPEIGIKKDLEKLKLTDSKDFIIQNLKPEFLQFALTGNYSQSTKAKLIARLKSISNDIQKSKPSDFDITKNSKANLTKASNTSSNANNSNNNSSNSNSKTISNSNLKDLEPFKIDKTQIIVVDKPNLKQAEVRIGHFGPKRNDPNFIPLYIANSAVGSGDFNSLLMQEIRVKRGLVYGINSYFAGLKDNGYFLLSASTRHDKVHELVSTALGIISDVKAKGITNDGLETQKGILLGQFPLKFETDESFINQIMRYKNYGFEDDYILKFYETIKNLNLESANAFLNQNYQPQQSLIVIYGTKKDLPKDLEKLGYPIQYMDYRKIF